MESKRLLFEVPFILICIFVSVFLSFCVRKIEADNKEIPLPELAEILLLELDAINKLDRELRFDSKENWNNKFNVYLERKRSDNSDFSQHHKTIRAIK